MVAIAGREQRYRDAMVRKHLPVVLPPLLDVYNKDLLKPEGPLGQDIGFGEPRKLSVWPIRPQSVHVKEVR
jgi:hypothetical protein